MDNIDNYIHHNNIHTINGSVFSLVLNFTESLGLSASAKVEYQASSTESEII